MSKNRYQCDALRKGLVEAQYNLAQMYHYGLGVKKNLTYAAMLYEIAAEQGMKEASFIPCSAAISYNIAAYVRFFLTPRP